MVHIHTAKKDEALHKIFTKLLHIIQIHCSAYWWEKHTLTVTPPTVNSLIIMDQVGFWCEVTTEDRYFVLDEFHLQKGRHLHGTDW